MKINHVSKSFFSASLFFFCSGSLFAQWSITGSNVYLTTSTNSVGIGTSSPAAKLDLVGGNMNLNDNTIFLRNDANHGLGWYGTGKTFASTAVNGPVLFGYGGGALGYSNGSQNIVLSWNSSNNVGIFTSTPNARLDVNGTIRTNGIIYLAGGTDVNNGLGYNALSTFTPNGPVLYGWGGGALGSKVSSTEKIALVWDVNGQVGIGTTAPAAKLEVKSNGAYSNGILVTTDNDLAKVITVTNTAGTGPVNFLVYGSGKVYAREVTVQLGTFPDYVFEKNYKLKTIDELSFFITNYKHLPNIPSAAEVKENNIGIGEMQVKLLEKVEELSLYIVQINERLKALEAENAKLKATGN